MSDSGGPRDRDLYRTPGGSSESVNGGGPEDFYPRRGGASHSTPVNHTSTPGLTPNSSSRPVRRPRGLLYDDDSRLLSPDTIGGSGLHGNLGYRPGSAELSHNTSSSNSPVNCRDSLERLQGRSASLSSDDVVGLSHDVSQHALPRSSTLPYDTPPTRASTRPGHTPGHTPGHARTHSSSPGSEMVTLEEFLYESNTLSPPTVHTGSREDLMTDYFARGTGGERDRCPPGRAPPLRDGAKTPTSYVTPTLKTGGGGGGGANKPGQSVKPSVRLPESVPAPSHSQTLPPRASNGLGGSGGTPGGRPSSVHTPGSRVGGASGGGLSRTFSLASADLLRSNGPDSFRPDASPSQPEGVVRRPGGGAAARERPLSARLPGPTTNQHREGGYSPVTPPLHHHSSLSLQTERHSGGRSGTNRNSPAHGRPAPQQHRGEVAMVTPVRAVPALHLEEAEEEREGPREARHMSDSPLLKSPEAGGGGGGRGCGSEEQPKSAPASPDPSNDPQTVWYEYGCV